MTVVGVGSNMTKAVAVSEACRVAAEVNAESSIGSGPYPGSEEPATPASDKQSWIAISLSQVA